MIWRILCYCPMGIKQQILAGMMVWFNNYHKLLKILNSFWAQIWHFELSNVSIWRYRCWNVLPIVFHFQKTVGCWFFLFCFALSKYYKILTLYNFSQFFPQTLKKLLSSVLFTDFNEVQFKKGRIIIIQNWITFCRKVP